MCGNFALWYVICFRRGDQWSPLRRADVVTYGVIGAKGVPYEVNGKSRCAVKCGV